METNSKKCPYCYSKLKKSELNCPKCREKIFTKETRIKSVPWSLLFHMLFFSLIIIVPFWLLFYIINFYSDFRDIYIRIFIAELFISSLATITFIIHKSSESFFIISSEKIQVKTRHFLRNNNNVILELFWKEIYRIELIKERYKEISHSSLKSDSIVFGYNLKFYLSERIITFRPWCLKFRKKKMKEKITNLIREFSKHMKKEIIELEDLEKVKSWKDICSKENLNYLENSSHFDISL